MVSFQDALYTNIYTYIYISQYIRTSITKGSPSDCRKMEDCLLLLSYLMVKCEWQRDRDGSEYLYFMWRHMYNFRFRQCFANAQTAFIQFIQSLCTDKEILLDFQLWVACAPSRQMLAFQPTVSLFCLLDLHQINKSFHRFW